MDKLEKENTDLGNSSFFEIPLTEIDFEDIINNYLKNIFD